MSGRLSTLRPRARSPSPPFRRTFVAPREGLTRGRRPSRSRSRSPVVRVCEKVCPLKQQAESILRAWAEDKSRAKRSNRSFSPDARELKALEDYIRSAVGSTESALKPGTVYPYVEKVFQKWESLGSPEKVLQWMRTQRSDLQRLKDAMGPTPARLISKDEHVKEVGGKVKLDLLLNLMRSAKMDPSTIDFIRTMFVYGVNYVGRVPLTGLFEKVPYGSERGKYEVKDPTVLTKLFDVSKTTVLSGSSCRVPDTFTRSIYKATLVEIDPKAEGALPYKTVLGPFKSFEELPEPELHPAFRFWVQQDTSQGADEGRVVDDLTASGANARTLMFERLRMVSLDDFAATVERMDKACPASVWGLPEFFKRDMRKAFRQVPADPSSRKWGAFSVRNPDTKLFEVFQHLSLPFGSRSAPLLFCALALVLCQLAAHHMGIPIVSFVDDFFAPGPKSLSSEMFENFRWFVVDLLGFQLKTEKDKNPAASGTLLGVDVTLFEGGNGLFDLPPEKRAKYIKRVLDVLESGHLSPGQAAKLAGVLSFATSVSLGRFGRPFLQPIYAIVSGRPLDAWDLAAGLEGDHVAQGKASGLPHRLQHALQWWVSILKSFPGRTFAWGRVHKRPVFDGFTDASAESTFEGLGGVLIKGSLSHGWSYRLDNVPEELEVFLPPRASQKVRIAQLELLAVLIFLRLFAPELRGSYLRMHIDNLSAMYCLINGYSGNSYMSRMAAEVWMVLLEHDILPWFQYVPSKLNVSDIWSRPDRAHLERRLRRRWKWANRSPEPVFSPLAQNLLSRPEVAWGEFRARLHDGKP
jgi:hypothetical protein